MDKVGVLCVKDKAMLVEFSSRVLQRISGRTLFLHLPFITDYLEANVRKEAEKDRIIIAHAAAAFPSCAGDEALVVDSLFEETKSVDAAFVKTLLIPSIAITVRYEDIADIRKKRIQRLLKGVYKLLAQWEEAVSFEECVRKAYSERRFKEDLGEMLHLYSLEIRSLNNSIRFLSPLKGAVNFFADALFDAMQAASTGLVRDCGKKIFGGDAPHA
jgi:hypothetical protein